MEPVLQLFSMTALAKAIERDDHAEVCKNIREVYALDHDGHTDIAKKAILHAARALVEHSTMPIDKVTSACCDAVNVFINKSVQQGRFDVVMEIFVQLGVTSIEDQEAKLKAKYDIDMRIFLKHAIRQNKLTYVQKMLPFASAKTAKFVYWWAVKFNAPDALKLIHELGRGSAEDNKQDAVFHAINADSLAIVEFLLPFVPSTAARALVFAARERPTCDALALVCAQPHFTVDPMWLIPSSALVQKGCSPTSKLVAMAQQGEKDARFLSTVLADAIKRDDHEDICKYIRGAYAFDYDGADMEAAMMHAARNLLENDTVVPISRVTSKCSDAVYAVLHNCVHERRFELAMKILTRLGIPTIVHQEKRLMAKYGIDMLAFLGQAIKLNELTYVRSMLPFASVKTAMCIYWLTVACDNLDALQLIHELGRDYSDVVDNRSTAIYAINVGSLAIARFLLPFVSVTAARELVFAAKRQPTCDALIMILEDQRFAIDSAWLAPDIETTPDVRALLRSEALARTGEMQLGAAAVVERVMRLPLPLAFEVHGFAFGSVNQDVQSTHVDAVVSAARGIGA